MNASKTELTKVYIATTEKDEHGNLIKSNEEWHKNKLLGSHLCTKSDIQQRINEGNMRLPPSKRFGSLEKLDPRKENQSIRNPSGLDNDVQRRQLGCGVRVPTEAECYNKDHTSDSFLTSGLTGYLTIPFTKYRKQLHFHLA